MNYLLSPHEIEIQAKAREFAQAHVGPYVDELDLEERFPVEILAKMSKEGFLGAFFPKEYGGTGGGGRSLSVSWTSIRPRPRWLLR